MPGIDTGGYSNQQNVARIKEGRKELTIGSERERILSRRDEGKRHETHPEFRSIWIRYFEPFTYLKSLIPPPNYNLA